jgi:hypothetical protein
MDRVTQQNASLVEESASAAAALEEQASLLTQAVAAFRLNTQGQNQRATVVSAAPSVTSAAALSTSKPATAGGDNNWETF